MADKPEIDQPHDESGKQPGEPGKQQPGGKLEKVQIQVDCVKDAMMNNIELVLKRGDDLERITSQSESLNDVARSFKTQAVSVKKQQMWAKYRWYLCCLVFALIVLSGLIIAIIMIIKK